jgi:hypothetical protein
MSRPNFHRLWTEFPDHTTYPSLKDFYTMLGGAAAKNINSPGFGPNGNTCASRMSAAFNKAGAPIDAALAQAAGARTLGTADGSRIIYAVAELRKYLLSTLGKPAVDTTSPYGDAFDGHQGVIAFSVNWDDATGHIALWNGTAFREPDHDDYSTYVNSSDPNVRTSRAEFWELA